MQLRLIEKDKIAFLNQQRYSTPVIKSKISANKRIKKFCLSLKFFKHFFKQFFKKNFLTNEKVLLKLL